MTALASTTCSADGTITTFRVDGGGLEPLATSRVGAGVSTLAVDASGRHGWSGTKEPPGIATVVLDPGTGTWSVAHRTPVEDSQTYLTMSGDARFLLGASYGGGSVQVWPLADGVPLEPVARVEHRNPHCVVERDGVVHVVCLGEDLVASYRLEGDGSLTPIETVAMPKDSGPRHLVIDDAGNHAYVVTEFSGEVVHLERDPETGRMTAREVVAAHALDRGLRHSEYGADPVEHHYVWGADLHLAQRFLVVSERCESTLAVLPVADDGTLGEQVCLVDTERQPRGFTTSSDGRLVVCPGEKSDHVSLFTLSGDGQLTLQARVPNGQGANWARLLEG